MLIRNNYNSLKSIYESINTKQSTENLIIDLSNESICYDKSLEINPNYALAQTNKKILFDKLENY